MVKSFKDYIKEINKLKEDENVPKLLPALETCFGTHSLKKNKNLLPALETQFGKHSRKPIRESTESSDIDHDKEHAKAPIDLERADHKTVEGGALKRYTEDSYYLNNLLQEDYKKLRHQNSNFGDDEDPVS